MSEMKFQKKLEVFFSNSYKKREKCAVFEWCQFSNERNRLSALKRTKNVERLIISSNLSFETTYIVRFLYTHVKDLRSEFI